MRKPRNKPAEQPVQEETSKRVNKPPVWDTSHLHSFKEQAIKVLNYLDSIGEGIYDEGRYGGMYLHQNVGGILPTRVIKAIKEEKKQEQVQSQEEEKSDMNDIFAKMFGK